MHLFFTIGIVFLVIFIPLLIRDIIRISHGERANTQMFGRDASLKELVVLLIISGILLFGMFSLRSIFPESSGSASKRCVICGKKTGLRKITNSAGDDSWYCSEHYADAWQYYYGE